MEAVLCESENSRITLKTYDRKCKLTHKIEFCIGEFCALFNENEQVAGKHAQGNIAFRSFIHDRRNYLMIRDETGLRLRTF